MKTNRKGKWLHLIPQSIKQAERDIFPLLSVTSQRLFNVNKKTSCFVKISIFGQNISVAQQHWVNLIYAGKPDITFLSIFISLKGFYLSIYEHDASNGSINVFPTEAHGRLQRWSYNHCRTNIQLSNSMMWCLYLDINCLATFLICSHLQQKLIRISESCRSGIFFFFNHQLNG